MLNAAGFRSKLVQYSVFIHIPPAETSKLMNSGHIYIVALVSITVAISASLPTTSLQVGY